MMPRPLVIILLLVCCGVGCAESFLIHPSTNPIDPGGASRVEFGNGGGGVIEAFAARSFEGKGAPDAYVLEFTGNATRAEQIATFITERWRPYRIEAWTVNYPGFGGSTGPCTLRSIAPMALRSYDELARVAGGKPIYVCSNSFGATAALHVAANRTVAGLIIQNPPALRQIVMSYGWWNLWLGTSAIALQIPQELDAPASARNVTAPAIFITTDKDQLVPPKNQQLTIDAYAGPTCRLILTGKGHHDSIDTEEEWQAFREMVAWMVHHRSVKK